MGNRLWLAELPVGWVSVERTHVHPDWPSTSHPAVDYFYFYDKWWVAPKDAPPAKPVDPIRSQVLDEAKGLINGDRQEHYGPPSVNFERIATGWRVFKPDTTFTAADVAWMMGWVKMARAVEGYKHDTAVDWAAYAALYAELSEES